MDFPEVTGVPPLKPPPMRPALSGRNALCRRASAPGIPVSALVGWYYLVRSAKRPGSPTAPLGWVITVWLRLRVPELPISAAYDMLVLATPPRMLSYISSVLACG
ncbi:hypothetical protein NDU88_001465 [Pleurodeles waltl]|uniref:Uncharacterized protein n=1 Tax=Pleurodeles waltl TaxID=8319 RepID=A0AAV7VAI2_PLEWA|nr:hypothetical protein NDU88_001465 [Pleurodeles waltl]